MDIFKGFLEATEFFYAWQIVEGIPNLLKVKIFFLMSFHQRLF